MKIHCFIAANLINGRAQPILCTSNTLLKIINKQQAHKAPIKCRTQIFDLPNAISVSHNTLIQLLTARHNNARTFNRTTITFEFSIVSRAAVLPLARARPFYAYNITEMYGRLMRSVAYEWDYYPQSGTGINLTIEKLIHIISALKIRSISDRILKAFTRSFRFSSKLPARPTEK